ncbi:MAG: 3-deoxy-D-manno-octulosonate 8-phosphate phosphatase, partial [Rikenellaceae bacterium]|nr:3-deoxy-D-manno-octulosonate 8-phosphate phosphatase [Rikenellaceae bacterium]
MGNFKEDLAAVRAFVFDVDGVFTDGNITVTPDNDFIRTYNAKDGFAMKHLARIATHPVAIITAGLGNSLMTRFKMLG